MSKMIEERIECPFFLKHNSTSITCEGILKGSDCVHRFRSNKQKDYYAVEHCCSHGGRSCQHYRNVSILYERGLKA